MERKFTSNGESLSRSESGDAAFEEAKRICLENLGSPDQAVVCEAGQSLSRFVEQDPLGSIHLVEALAGREFTDLQDSEIERLNGELEAVHDMVFGEDARLETARAYSRVLRGAPFRVWRDPYRGHVSA